MAYLPNIPQPNDRLSISQGNLLNNFTLLGAIAGNINSASSSININSGFNWVYLPTQGASIPPAGAVFPADNVGIYSATNTATTRNELYINRTISTGVVQVPMTASVLGTSAPTPGTFGGAGWTLLPSGIKMVWGTSLGSLTGPQTVTITGAASFGTTIISVQCTIIDSSATAAQAFVRVRTIAANSFTVVVSNVGGSAFNNSHFTYLAIGY